MLMWILLVVSVVLIGLRLTYATVGIAREVRRPKLMTPQEVAKLERDLGLFLDENKRVLRTEYSDQEIKDGRQFVEELKRSSRPRSHVDFR